jgi:hypothetical protein
MAITFYRAKLKTAGKTPEEIRAAYDGPTPDDTEVASWVKVYNDLDGMEVMVMNSLVSGENYCIAAWDKKDDEKMMEFHYLAEQDPFFGSYIDEREEFIKDWKAEEYEPAGSLVFSKDDVQIIEELSKETMN